MGTGCSLSSPLPVLACTSGRPVETRDVVVSVFERNFSVSSVAIYSRQSVKWRWSEGFHNVLQVVSDGSRPVAVKGGIKSGLQRNSGNFSHEFQIPGCYQFVSQGHSPSVVLDITVIEKPPKAVKLSDDGFSPRCLEARLGETVVWTWNECFRPQTVQRVCFNSKEGTFVSADDREYVAPSLCGSYSYTFKFPGIYYFETEASYVSSTTHLCLVKVRTSAREHRIDVSDNGFKPSLLSVTEGDSVWWHWNKRKCQQNHNVREVQFAFGSDQSTAIVHVVGGYCSSPAKSRTGACRIICDHPGVTYYSSDGCPDNICVVIVKRKCSEHVVKLTEEGFKPDLRSVGRGDIVQFKWDTTRLNNDFFISRVCIVKDHNLGESEELLEAQSEGLDWNKIEQLNELGCHVEEAKDVGVYSFQVKTNHDPQHRDMSLLVQPSPQDYGVDVTQSGFLPNRLQIHVGDQIRWQWDSPTVLCNVVQVSDRMEPIEGGFFSGPQTTTGAFIHCFDVPGTYFCASGMGQFHQYCVVEVFEKPQLYEIEISEEGSSPNPLTVSPGDWVCWIWDGVYNFRIQELSTQSVSDTTNRRSYARVFSTEGVHHFLFSSSSNSSNSVTSSILVEKCQNFNTVQLSSTGFAPTVTTVAQGDDVTWQWNDSEELHNVFRVVPPTGGGMSRRLVPMDGPASFSSGEPVPNSSFTKTFDHPGTFIVGSDGALGSQGVVVVVRDGSQVAPPTLAKNIANTVPVGYTIHLHCLTDDVDVTYTLDGSYPSLQNDIAEMYDSDVGIVFESPGAYLIRALACKEDMMPSEVMTSSLFFVTEEPKQGEVKHVANSTGEVKEAEAAPQSASEIEQVDSLQNASVSNDLALSWGMPDLIWEPGSVEGSGTISWPFLDWMCGNISSFALFIDGVLYCEMPISREDDTILDCKRVEVQDLELGHVYKAVLLGKQQGSGVVVASDELSFVASQGETVEPTNIPEPEPGNTPIDYAITDDEKMQQIVDTQQTSTVTDEHQGNSVTGTDVEQLDFFQVEVESSGTVNSSQIEEHRAEEEVGEDETDRSSEHQEMTSRQANKEEGTDLDMAMAVAEMSLMGQEDKKSVSTEGKECEETVDREEAEQAGQSNERTEVQDVANEIFVNSAPLHSSDDDAIGETAMDLATADEVEVEEIVAVESATNEMTTGEVAGIENQSCGFPSATALRPLAKLWLESCSLETVLFSWESVNWDFSDGGSLLLRVEGEHFSSSIDSVSTYRYGESGSMECDMSLERHLVHSWKIHGVSTSEGFSVSGCLVGCTYKAWLCSDTSTLPLSEIVEFTIPFPPEAPLLKVLNILDDEVTLGWLGVHLSPRAVLRRFQVYRDGRVTGSVSSSALQTKLSGFQEDTPCTVSVAAVVSQQSPQGGREANVAEQILHSDLVTIYKPLRPSTPQLTQKDVMDQNGAIGIAWTMLAGQTEPTAFDIRVNGVSRHTIPAGCTLDTTLDVSKSQQVSSLNVIAELGATGKDSGISDEETSVDHSDVETQHSFVFTDCQPRKAYKITVVALMGDKVIEMESGRAVILPSASLESNCISVVCASVPNPPKLRLENVDHLGISFSWDKPDEFGEAKISGYLVEVNKHRQILMNENDLSYSLTDCEIGRKYHFTVTALTEHACCQGNTTTDKTGVGVSKLLSDTGYEADTETSHLVTPTKPQKIQEHISSHDLKSSLRAQYPGCLPSQPLTVCYSQFVLPPTDLAVSELRANSVVLSWTKGKPSHQKMHRSKEQRWSEMPKKMTKHLLDPEKFLVRWWKRGVHPAVQEVERDETEREQKDETIVCQTVVKASDDDSHAVVLCPFEIQTKYCVTVESQSRLYTSPHTTHHLTLKARSEPFECHSAQPPSCVSDLQIAAVSFTLLLLRWSLPVEKGIAVKCLEVDVLSMDGVVLDRKIVTMPAVTCCFDSLQPNFQYMITVYSHTRTQDEVEHEQMSCTKYTPPSVSIVASTLGLTPTSKLQIASRTDAAYLSWSPATPHGPAFIQQYIVQWQETVKSPKRQVLNESSHFMLESISTQDVQRDEEWSSEVVSCEDCTYSIQGLIAGLSYCFRVVTVLKSTVASSDMSYEPDRPEAIFSTFWHVGDPVYFQSPVTVGKPCLLVTAYTTTDIQLYWPKPSMRVPIKVDDQGKFMDKTEDTVCNPCYKGVASVLKSYRIKVDGYVFATLGNEQNKYIVTGRQPGSGCRLQLEAVSYGEGTKKRKGMKGRKDGGVSSDDYGISPSDEVSVSLPDLEKCPILSLACHFAPSSPSYEMGTPSCDGDEDESMDYAPGVIAVEWQVNSRKISSITVRKFIVRWSSDKNPTLKSMSLPANTHCYDIQSPVQRDVYSVTIEAVSLEGADSYVSPAVQCQVPGPPDPPKLWLHAATENNFTIAWSEPQTYGNVMINAYQTYVNGKKTGNLLETVHRRAVIPCKRHKQYEITMVAVSDSGVFGDSAPSCPLVVNGTDLFATRKLAIPKKVQFADSTDDMSVAAKKPSDPIPTSSLHSKKERQKGTGKESVRKLVLQVDCREVTGDTISLDWSKFISSDDIARYEIRWSSVFSPSSKKVVVGADEHSYRLTDCQMGTSYFIRVLALGDKNVELARSKQLTIQTAALPGPPTMTIKDVSGCNVVLKWQQPELFGPTRLIGYKLQIECNNKCQEVELNTSGITYSIKCKPCELYTFRVKGVTAECGDGPYSPSVCVTCDGVVPSPLTIVPTGMVSTVKVHWDPPTVHGNIKIRAYKLFWLVDSDSKSNATYMPVSQLIENHAVICHGPLNPTTSEDEFSNVPSTGCWVVAAIYSSQMEVAYSVPLKAYPARPPMSPAIAVTVVNLSERKRLETMAHRLISQRDSLQLKLHWQKSKQSRKVAKKRETELSRLARTLAATEKELLSCLRSLQQQTGYASVCVSWEKPWDDGDATVSGYQLIVDGSPWGKQLPLSTRDIKMKLGISNSTYQVQLTALSEHPIGNSLPGNAVEVSTIDFQPFAFYCFNNVHEEGSEWPNHGSCSYLDSLMYELTRHPTGGSAVYPHLGFLGPHPIQSACEVLDLSNGMWKNLMARKGDAPVPTQVLFWTRWCRPSLTVVEHFVHLADDMNDECHFVACCIETADKGIESALCQLVQQTVTEQNWDRPPNILQHAVTGNGIGTMKSALDVLGIVGVPTWLCLHPSGYVGWQGRIAFELYEDLKSYIDDLLDIVLGRKERSEE